MNRNVYLVREADLGRVSMSFGEERIENTYLWFEPEFSSIHRSTSTSITASSEDLGVHSSFTSGVM